MPLLSCKAYLSGQPLQISSYKCNIFTKENGSTSNYCKQFRTWFKHRASCSKSTVKK